MKKFTREIIIFITSIIVSATWLYNLEKPTLVKKALSINEELDIVNLGTSHGGAFEYSDLFLNGESFNRGGNTLYYDLQNYKYLKNYLAENAIIILPISYFSFGLDENRKDRGANNPFVNDFYMYLPKEFIYNYSNEKRFSVVLYRIQSNFFNELNSVFLRAIDNNKEAIALDKDLTDNSHIAKLKKHASGRGKHHKTLGTFSDAEKNLHYLSQLISDAKRSGYKPVLVTTPYYKEYSKGFEENWLEENYYNYIFMLSERYDVPYLDYGRNTRIASDPNLFRNSDHLNKEGISIFIRMLWDDLLKIGFLDIQDMQETS